MYENIIFRLTKEWKATIKAEADKRGMTITGLIKVALRKYLAEN